MTIRSRTEVREVPLPSERIPEATLPRVDFADAFEIELPAGAGEDPEPWVRALFADPPAWVSAAMTARNAAVRLVGLRTTTGLSERGFPLIARTVDEVVLGLDDRHLDFRVSVLTRPRGGRRMLVVATRVYLRNAAARAYFAVVRPVHPHVVRAMMRRALEAG